jgi:hypothetical protein
VRRPALALGKGRAPRARAPGPQHRDRIVRYGSGPSRCAPATPPRAAPSRRPTRAGFRGSTGSVPVASSSARPSAPARANERCN